MDAFFAHAIVDASTAASGDRREARAAKALSLQLLGLAGERPLTRTWRARAEDGHPLGLVVLVDGATQPELERFAASAERLRIARAIEGVLRVLSVAPSRDAFTSDLWTTGCAADLPALQWSPRRRLEFVRQVTRSLDLLHRAGLVHGCLSPSNVLLDDDLQPVLTEVGQVSVHGLVARKADASSYLAFASAEVKNGEEPGVRDDLWSVGRLLDHVVGEREVPQVGDVVRRCAAPVSHVRFSSAAELVDALDDVMAQLPRGDRNGRTGASPVPDAAPRERRSLTNEAPRERRSFTNEAPRERRSLTNEAPRDRRSLTNEAASRATPTKATAARGVAWRFSPWPAVVGGTALAVAAVGTFTLGVQGGAARAFFEGMFCVGIAVATWVAPPLPFGRRALQLAGRLVLALLAAALVVVVDPMSAVLRAGALSRLHGSDGARRAAVAEIVELGRDFRGLRLAGLDLSGFDLTGADFRGADLSRADLSGSRLWGAQFDRASLDGARLGRANLEDTSLSEARHVETAECDDGTQLPRGWRCNEGKLSR